MKIKFLGPIQRPPTEVVEKVESEEWKVEREKWGYGWCGRCGWCGWLMLSTLMLLPSIAVAYEYRVEILIDDEDDIYELLGSGDLTSDEADTLMELLREPLDINTASREELYNLPGLTYSMVDAIIERREEKTFTRISQLQKAAGVTGDVFAQLKPFVRVTARAKKGKKEKKSKVQGAVRAKVADRIRGKGTSATSTADEYLPESFLRAVVKDPGVWEFGAAVVTQNTIGNVSNYGSNLEQQPFIVKDDGTAKDFDHDKYYFLKTSGETYLPSWPKAYARVKMGKVDALAGSYRVGFGQRLVFDKIGQKNPYGFKPDLYISEGQYGFSIYKGMFGAVATIPLLQDGKMKVEVTPFVSWWRYDVSQYHVKHRRKSFEGGACHKDNDESGDPADPNCYERYSLLVPYDETSFTTLSSKSIPMGYSEAIVGANATVFYDKKSHVGLTYYGSMVDFHFGDDDTVFRGYTNLPERDMFGGAGVDAAHVERNFSLFAEAAVMDNLTGAGIIRGISEIGDFVVEGSVRYYQDDYDNPHARGYAMSDTFESSLRMRGERGGMLSVKYRPAKWVSVRVDGDIWTAPVWEDKDFEEKVLRPLRMETFLRVDTTPIDKLRLGAFVQMTDRDLDESGWTQEYTTTGSTPPRGEKFQGGVQFSTRLIPNIQFWAYYKASFLGAGPADKDIPDSPGTYTKDHYGVAKIRFKPLGFVATNMAPWLVVDLRGKYFQGDMEDGDTGDESAERYFESYAQVGTTLAKKYHLGVRGAMREHYEKTTSTGTSTKATEYFWKAVAEWKF